MYIKPTPIGTNPPDDEDRRAIWRVTGGDDWYLSTRVELRGQPATPSNSKLRFVLTDSRFCEDNIWEAEWNDGITEVDPQDSPGLVKITIPDEVSDTLRRGSYLFSLTVSDRFGRETYTIMKGSMLVEYEPTSPHKSIPYKEPS